MEGLGIFGATDMIGAVASIPALLSGAMSHVYYSYTEILAVVGVFYIMWKMFNFLYFCYTLIQLHVTPWLLNKTKHIQHYGEWAIVTGATAGIGKEYAEELAKHGMNILLISRSKEKLQEVSDAITKTYGVKTRFIIADFSRERFAKVPEDKVWEIINVNIAAAVMMAHIVLPGMVERKRGAIVNVTSATCCQPVPLMTLYAATKVMIIYVWCHAAGLFIYSINKHIKITELFITSHM
ncbi:hypothetical protein GDO81_025748 [Engystomops pustulosus]|uniref:Uncharacterized protein n=1 Tax=Engystomops pustulosus TaxID=76066 RepID=A0AAV6ZAI1_ENGPU|nr:hypothetical protein GDO81_025748 [Engystomops pustulosus]